MFPQDAWRALPCDDGEAGERELGHCMSPINMDASMGPAARSTMQLSLRVGSHAAE